TEAWQFMDGSKIVTVQPQGRFKADSATALAAAAAAGLGIAWLPDCITYEYVASGALVPIMTSYPVPPGAAYVVRLPGQHPTRKVRVLTEMLTEYFKRNPDLSGLDR
ncbi:MAG: LysR family transcriptional regulator, partial [Mesorhizobium sp.]